MARQDFFVGSIASATATGSTFAQTGSVNSSVTLCPDRQGLQLIWISYDDAYVNAAASSVMCAFGAGNVNATFTQVWQHTAAPLTTELWIFPSNAPGFDPPYPCDVQVGLASAVGHLAVQTCGVSMVSYDFYGPLITDTVNDDRLGPDSSGTASIVGTFSTGLKGTMAVVADENVYVAPLWCEALTGTTATLSSGTQLIAPFSFGTSPTLYEAALAYIRGTGGTDTVTWDFTVLGVPVNRQWLEVLVAPATLCFDPRTAGPISPLPFLR